MRVDVYLTPRGFSGDALKGRLVVVVDVLRACSTLTAALVHGARAVVPVADMAEASRIAGALDPETSLLGGERGGKRIDGYAAGNSPLEYGPAVVAGRTVVLNTTNGTGAFVAARGAAQAVAGCFLNASRVADFLREAVTTGTEKEAVILCAGQDGRVALEDVLCAGFLLDRLWGADVPDRISDGAHIALTQYRHDARRLARTLYGCAHTQRLIALGHGDDVAYCARLDAFPVLPRYRDSRLVLDAADRAWAEAHVAALADAAAEGLKVEG
ncbi:MAG TPA: 2-phosphosulfolactate phosphatase [Rubricoccaceae bacterium]|nr:2-phosphosulfolactate phosphatase [Rubricoccaceae bacterium]